MEEENAKIMAEMDLSPFKGKPIQNKGIVYDALIEPLFALIILCPYPIYSQSDDNAEALSRMGLSLFLGSPFSYREMVYKSLIKPFQ